MAPLPLSKVNLPFLFAGKPETPRETKENADNKVRKQSFSAKFEMDCSVRHAKGVACVCRSVRALRLVLRLSSAPVPRCFLRVFEPVWLRILVQISGRAFSHSPFYFNADMGFQTWGAKKRPPIHPATDRPIIRTLSSGLRAGVGVGRSVLSSPTSAATSRFRPHSHCLPPPPAVPAERTWGPEFADTD